MPGHNDEEEGESVSDSDTLEGRQSNEVSVTVILAKTVIGAGVAAVPLTDATLGWPLALAFLLLVAFTTKVSLDIIFRMSEAQGTSSYPELTQKSLGSWWALLLQIAIIAFGLGLMLVYCVVVGDMLVGKEGYAGLLCGSLGSLTCSRPLVVGLVTLLVLLPAVSFRKLESTAVGSWIGMSALIVWSAATVLLLIAAVVKGRVQHVNWKPDTELLGKSGFRIFANICAIIPILTTAYSCQAAGPFVLAELRPKSAEATRRVIIVAVAITTAIYALISLGSYLVFGRSVQSDVLHNFTPASLHHLLPTWLAETLYVIVRLSFLLGVLTLFPLMMFPARDGLVRIFSGRTEPLPPLAFYLVTYGICIAVYAVSVVTPSIWGPIQIIGATAGAVIGFVIPGLLFFRTNHMSGEEASLLESENSTTLRWSFKSGLGWLLLLVGIIQCVTGIASQALASSQ